MSVEGYMDPKKVSEIIEYPTRKILVINGFDFEDDDIDVKAEIDSTNNLIKLTYTDKDLIREAFLPLDGIYQLATSLKAIPPTRH